MLDLQKLEFVRRQLLARELNRARVTQLAKLKEWEDKINKIDRGARIFVENDVDLEIPAPSLNYVNSYMVRWNVTVSIVAGVIFIF